MSEMENVQPQEERVEGGEQVESTERAEKQDVEDATHEPGARVEQTQNYEQAEAVESAVTEAVDNVEQAEAKPAPESVETVTEVDVAQEVGTVDRDDHKMIDGESLSEASEDEDDDAEAATPINVPAPEQVDVETQERLATQEGDDSGSGQDATPIVIPDIATEAVTGDGVEEKSGTPQPIPKPADEIAGTPQPIPQPAAEGSSHEQRGSKLPPESQVAEMPEPGGHPPGPNQEAELDSVKTQAVSGQAGRPGGDVAATPINLPDEANTVEGGPGGQPGDDVSATPINLPREANVIDGAQGEQVAHVDHWSEMPDPGEDPPPPNLEADTYVETGDRLSEDAELEAAPWIRVGDDGSELMEELETNLEAGVEGEISQESEVEGPAPEALTEEGESEESLSEAEEQWKPPDVYVHYDSSGKMTVVDANGKPVDSPPALTSPDGKTYQGYYPGMYNKAGEKITFKIPVYKAPLKDLYLHDDGSGNLTVVNANGKPVDSPPILSSPDGQSYVAYYPGGDKTGDVVQLKTYKAPLKDLYLHDDGSGNLTVVDANGKPIDSPPIVTSPDGQSYVAYYPGGDKTGDIVQLQTYKAPLKDMYLYDDGSGNLTVVDANGKPVDSPPIVTSPDGQSYMAYYPGGEKSGDAVQLKTYQAPVKDMYIHEDGSGKLTVVDANGKPVDSPPIVTSSDGKSYAAYYPGGDKSAAPVQLETYKAPLKDMYLHVDSSGKLTVVDANGKPVDSPPIVTSPDGQSYIAYYPGGNQTGDVVQMKFYKPSSEDVGKI